MRSALLLALFVSPLSIAHALVALAAQPAPTSRPSFEVATIKESERGESGGTAGFQPGGRFRAVNIEVTTLMETAYGTRERPLFPFQILDAPSWLSTRYVITAKVPDDFASRTPIELYAQMPAFIQSLLEDRFKLKIHRETRELPVFSLRLVRKDGRLGPHMLRSTARCPDERDKCSLQFQTGHVHGGAMEMSTLVGILSARTERVVIDRTGLAGAFDVTLDWSSDQAVTDKPSIFAAVQEQLGLTLESTRGPVDAVVIDHIEKPVTD